MTTQPDPIELVHAEVRDHYAERAQRLDACCGSSSSAACCTETSNPLYPASELDLLPAGMAEASWGCGNPTAIAALQPGEVVLDLGSGGGLDVMLAARKVGATGFVYGVDMTDEMLALATRNAAKAGVSNVEFRKGQIEAIPLPDASVDVIISNCVINLSPDKGQTLRDALRVLRPGGRLAVSDIVVDGTLDDLPVSEAQVRGALSWAGCVAGALSIDDYRRLLADAGFEAIQIDVKHRYTLAELGQENGGDLPFPQDLAEQLVDRFTSSNIAARRPLPN